MHGMLPHHLNCIHARNVATQSTARHEKTVKLSRDVKISHFNVRIFILKRDSLTK